ncbi:MAG: Rieske 2Fe-2S domain-containing protein [Candidatus Nanopelagicales bacterium]
MSNNFDLNNTFDPDQGKQPEKVTKGVPSKLPTAVKGVDHYLRRTDTDPKAAKRAERQVATMFALSGFFTLVFLVSFVAIPREKKIAVNLIGVTSAQNLVLGVSFGLAILLIGIGAIHWAKKLMPDVEMVQERKPIKPSDEVQQEALDAFRIGAQESGIGSRKLVRRTLLGALALFPLPFVVMLRDLGPAPKGELRKTAWEEGLHIVTDITYQKIRPEDIPVGNLISAMPENILEIQEETHTLNERGKSAILLVRMRPEDIKSQQGPDWDYQGILAYSKICTHVGCPIALYEQRTHNLLCPCHQSTFDLSDSGQPIFGPAARRLPQLAITVDEEGYLIARQGFQEPVGPSFWERGA